MQVRKLWNISESFSEKFYYSEVDYNLEKLLFLASSSFFLSIYLSIFLSISLSLSLSLSLYIYIYIYSISSCFRQLRKGWKNGGRSDLSKSIKSIYSVLDYLWSDGDDFNFLFWYIKPDYKIYRRTLKNLKDNFLSDGIISCYLGELVVTSQKLNKILIFKSTISATNIFFVTYQFTGHFLEYLRKPILYISHCWNIIISSALLSL